MAFGLGKPHMKRKTRRRSEGDPILIGSNIQIEHLIQIEYLIQRKHVD